MNMLSFRETVLTRRSSRGFLSMPVPSQTIQEALEEAQRAPSNCNTQPWNTHIVSGAKRDEVSEALLIADRENRFSPDFSFSMDAYYGRYAERKNVQAATYYKVLGVAREDEEGRRDAAALNYRFFNAPHAAFLFMPTFGDNVRVASDIGMYGQTFLLALAARGIASIPQTSLGFFADTIREVLGIPSELKMLFGISFGYHDDDAPGNLMVMDRDLVADSVTFHR
jgi:nitroreductase